VRTELHGGGGTLTPIAGGTIAASVMIWRRCVGRHSSIRSARLEVDA
jgi:hypothetical protein